MSTLPNDCYYQRLDLIVAHLPRYDFDTWAKLARDAGLGQSTIHDIVTNRYRPSLKTAMRLADVIGGHLGKPIGPDELFSFTGSFPTPICALCNCKGCGLSRAELPGGGRNPLFVREKDGCWEDLSAAHEPSI